MSTSNRLTDQLARRFAGAILSGAWPVGHRLPDDKTLCADYQLSRTVVREALRVIGAKGLIAARPRVGTYVAEQAHWALWDTQVLDWLAAHDLLAAYQSDLHDIRLALEPAIAALAASRSDAAGKADLHAALRALQTAPDTPHEQAFIDCLYALSGNAFARGAAALTGALIGLRASAPPLAHYSAVTAAISQGAPAEARRLCLHLLLDG